MFLFYNDLSDFYTPIIRPGDALLHFYSSACSDSNACSASSLSQAVFSLLIYSASYDRTSLSSSFASYLISSVLAGGSTSSVFLQIAFLIVVAVFSYYEQNESALFGKRSGSPINSTLVQAYVFPLIPVSSLSNVGVRQDLLSFLIQTDDALLHEAL